MPRTDLLTAAKLSVAMIQRRDDLRVILGPQYEPEVGETRTILRTLTALREKDIAAVALEMASEMDQAGHDPSIVIAALVDECESEGR